jgi:hypothetical protein
MLVELESFPEYQLRELDGIVDALLNKSSQSVVIEVWKLVAYSSHQLAKAHMRFAPIATGPVWRKINR